MDKTTLIACHECDFTQLRSPLIPGRRTRIYRLVEFVGRWSMLDIYVISILVAFVQFGEVATIDAGPGASAFDSSADGTVMLAVLWSVRATKLGHRASGRSVVSEAARGPEYDALVSAHDRARESVASDIAKAMNSVMRQ